MNHQRMLSIDGIIAVWFFLLGTCIGSFLNVVVYRLPRGESLIRPASRCPSCNHPIRPWDNIPVLSWIILRGRCRDCGSNISGRYPISEALMGFWFIGCSLLALNAAPTTKISSWILSVFLALFGAVLFASTQIVRAGSKVPRALCWVLLLALAGTLFALFSIIRT